MESRSSGCASKSRTFFPGRRGMDFHARRLHFHHAGGDGREAVVLFKNRKGGNIVAEIVGVILQEGRNGMDFERVLAYALARQRPRSQARLIETLRHR